MDWTQLETALSGLQKHLFLQAQVIDPNRMCLPYRDDLPGRLLHSHDLTHWFVPISATDFQSLRQTLGEPEIQYSIQLSLFSCSLSTLMSLAVAVPIGYLMSRFEFKGQSLVDAVLDIPIVLPPLVVGISLLVYSTTLLSTG